MMRSFSFGESRSASRARDNFDWPLFLFAALLAVIGVINLYSATSVSKASLAEIYIQQVYFLVVGGILATAAAAIDYRTFERFGYPLYVLGIVLLLLVSVLGRDIRGSSRWIYIGSFSFQPSEFMKLFLIIALAKYLHDDPKSEGRNLRDLFIPALITLVPVLLVLRQPDLGTALILALIFVSICALTRVRWQSIVALVIAGAVVTPLTWGYVLKDYQKQRISGFLNPEANILGANWHAHHARIAIGAGRITGAGFMRGTQNQFHFLPEQHSDFPFAVFAEDWGFLGSVFVVLLYLGLVLWAIKVSASAKDRFGAVLAIGVGALIFWHAFFNLGMVTGLLPVVGVTLPLFSAGGSSVITDMIGIGFLMNVSMRRAAGASLF
ncbi:MAG: rod shape-determining protein RodA [Polyangiaceae bacterium]